METRAGLYLWQRSVQDYYRLQNAGTYFLGLCSSILNCPAIALEKRSIFTSDSVLYKGPHSGRLGLELGGAGKGLSETAVLRWVLGPPRVPFISLLVWFYS